MGDRSKHDTQRRLEFIKKTFDKKTTILDIGSGYGFLLKALEENGFDSIGVEISKERRHISSRVTDVEIWPDKIEGPNQTNKKFDVITLFHVLEHISSPIKLCSDLQTYLKPEGSLIIEVPNANDHMLRLSKNYRKFFWQIAHVSYFTSQTIKKILKKAGFSNIKVSGIQRYSFENALHWLRNGKPQLESPS